MESDYDNFVDIESNLENLYPDNMLKIRKKIKNNRIVKMPTIEEEEKEDKCKDIISIIILGMIVLCIIS